MTRNRRKSRNRGKIVETGECVMHLSAGRFQTHSTNAVACIHGHTLSTRCYQCEPLPAEREGDTYHCSHGRTWNEDCDDCTSPNGAKYSDSVGTKYVGGATSYKAKATYRSCDHWQDEFQMLDGLTVLLSAYADRPGGYAAGSVDKRKRTVDPDIGFYLDDLWVDETQVMATPGMRVRWATPKSKTQTVIFPWQDYGTPKDMAIFANGVQWLLRKVESGATVEIGCIGGHGRTGTMLACLLVAQGMPAKDAVAMVRRKHCIEAIESISQVRCINALALILNDEEVIEFNPLTVDEPNKAPLYDAYGRRAWQEESDWGYNNPNVKRAPVPYRDRWWEDDDDPAEWADETEERLSHYAELATEWGLPYEEVKELFDKGLISEAKPEARDKAVVREAYPDDNVAYEDWKQRVWAMSQEDSCALDNLFD